MESIAYVGFSVLVAITLSLVSSHDVVNAPELDLQLPSSGYQALEQSLVRNYEGANLSLANFSHRDVSGANFRNALLDFANLSLAKLRGADLSGASLRYALLEYTDLSQVHGLTAEQLNEACLLRGDALSYSVIGFDMRRYVAPTGCQIWEQVPRR